MVSGGTAPYTWSVTSGLLPPGLALNSTTGVISGTPTTAGGPTSVTFRVTDSVGATASKSLAITIVAGPSITTSSLPNGEVSIAYSQTLAATGGTAPYTWSVTSGALPAGLALNSTTGVISGTPTTAGGPTSVTFKATDAVGGTASKSLAITIIAGPSITTSSLPNGEVSIAYSQTLAATGGTAPYTWSVTAGALPAGLALNSSTGVISGTPTAAGGPTSVAFKATDAAGGTASKSLAITIVAGTVHHYQFAAEW